MIGKPRRKPSLASEIRGLRSRIEAACSPPSLVLVTSATADDGAGLAARGLTESLRHAHQRAVLVTADPRLAPDRASGVERQSVVLLSPDQAGSLSKSGVRSLLDQLKASNDYVVVDGGNLSENSLGLLLVKAADVALITFCAGRPETALDRLLINSLEEAETKVLGVVMTDDAFVAQYDTPDEAAHAPRVAHAERTGHRSSERFAAPLTERP